jgi:hypothetical protein
VEDESPTTRSVRLLVKGASTTTAEAIRGITAKKIWGGRWRRDLIRSGMHKEVSPSKQLDSGQGYLHRDVIFLIFLKMQQLLQK